MESEQSKNFNERLSQWVANQGFWFQVRYSMAGSGMRGRAMIHLMRLGGRVLVFAMVAAVAGWIYLLKRTDSSAFQVKLRKDVQAGLAATEIEVQGGRRVQGQLEISRLAAEGGDETFFSSLEARNIHFKMGMLDGLLGVWQPGVISVARVELDLRAGADDVESANRLAAAAFHRPAAIELNSFEVSEATVRWGYSERTAGAIEGSALTVHRTQNGWRLNFKGGTFHQNWLEKLDVVNIVAICDPGGVLFEKAELKRGEGTVDFSGVRVAGGERPQVQGVVKIRHLDLEQCLPAAPRRFLEGVLSGDFRVFGSTNSPDGIGFEGQVILDGKDVITLREQVYLLKALSVVDYSRNYHRVDFREGSFQMKTLRSGVELTDVKLKAEDLFTMEGSLTVRLPTQEEIQTAATQGGNRDDSLMFAADDFSFDGLEGVKLESSFTLKQAAQQARRAREGTQSDAMTLFDRLALGAEMRRLQRQAADRMARMLRYEGSMRITIPGDAFERGPKLQQRYPVDLASGRIPMTVPIEGYLYELTVKQADEIYEIGER